MEHILSLFKISQVAKACSVSRATILRLEEDGLIRPSYKDPDSGYRYYSVNDLMRIRQVLSLRDTGFTSALIQKYLDQPADLSPLIMELEERVRVINNALGVLRQMSLASEKTTIGHMTVPVLNYYEKKRIISGSIENVTRLMEDTIREAIESGVHLNLNGNLLLITDRTDLLHGSHDEQALYEYTACVPVVNTPGGNVFAHPPSDTMYVLWNGDLTMLPGLVRLLTEQMEAERLQRLGPIGIETLMLSPPEWNTENGEIRAMTSGGERLFRIGIPIMPA